MHRAERESASGRYFTARLLVIRYLWRPVEQCRFLTRIDEGPGDETLSIEKHDGAIQPAAQLGLEFPTPAALDAYAAGLRLKGVAVAEGPIDRSWLWRDARVFDPDGHEWMLFFAGKNKLDPPWRVKRSG